MLLKKSLFSLFVAAVSVQTLSAQTAVADEMPARSRAEVIMCKTVAAAEVGSQVGAVKVEKDNVVATVDGQAIVDRAMKHLGAKYVWGHTGPHTFDCSGFTSYVYKKENIAITRTSRSQYTEGTPIHSTKELQKGDLVFFGGSSATRRVGHVGIVTDVDPTTGRFKFVHAARRGVRVDESTMTYYAKRYIGARRIIKN